MILAHLSGCEISWPFQYACRTSLPGILNRMVRMPFAVVYRDRSYEKRLSYQFSMPGSVQPVNGIAAFRKVGRLYPSHIAHVNSVDIDRLGSPSCEAPGCA